MSKIYDCFIYNGEEELLLLRLEYLYPFVDYFVIAEANRTFTGLQKPAYYELIADKLSKYKDKIRFIPVDFTAVHFPNAWGYEHFLRGSLKNGMFDAMNEDYVIIADVDEIIPLDTILNEQHECDGLIIELPTFYYFFNMLSTEVINITLFVKYKLIRDVPIGNRDVYKTWNLPIRKMGVNNQGGHFTYLFGYEIEKYIQKINSFSHSEFNTDYYKNKERIKRNICLGLDIFDREHYRFRIVNLDKLLAPSLLAAMKRLQMDNRYTVKYNLPKMSSALLDRNIARKFIRKEYYWVKQRIKKMLLNG